MDCSYCGREVMLTIHRREGRPAYRVDFYRLVTGDLQPMAIQNPRDEAETIEFFKLLNPRWVVACADCFQKDSIQEELHGLFCGVPEPKDAGGPEPLK